VSLVNWTVPGQWAAGAGAAQRRECLVSVIPVIVLPDGSNLQPFQLVVGILVVAALLLLLNRDPTPQSGSAAPQARP